MTLCRIGLGTTTWIFYCKISLNVIIAVKYFHIAYSGHIHGEMPHRMKLTLCVFDILRSYIPVLNPCRHSANSLTMWKQLSCKMKQNVDMECLKFLVPLTRKSNQSLAS